ncbi:hypothetical protein BOTBODRAFT_67731 [Botryobasidium botryosum FD-172 SS1]|uniref:FAS1 domain-containing protein n=1 Tax=Botryobasidium botryosum (strain FD-172 SS1) TaxID=930990 RepID=A0A067MBK3_BOTB1|nr:hypothetical protein BOTBODRAFT_67731 [Botryobasidium botryosum FD-172 SS1]
MLVCNILASLLLSRLVSQHPNLFASAAHIQAPLGNGNRPSTQSSTLIDALNADPDYTSLIQLIQRARLVPTLNKLNGSTFFAPTNDAINRYRERAPPESPWVRLLDSGFGLGLEDGNESHGLWDDRKKGREHDNVREALRQHLFYHLLNYTLPVDPTPGLSVHKTLLYPALGREPPSHEPPPSPPWMPVPGGSLDGEPQRLRTSVADNGAVLVGVDSEGKGGALVIKTFQEVGNGVVVGVDNVLDMPPDLATVIWAHSKLQRFVGMITEKGRKRLAGEEHLTMFFPVDEAWDELDPLEKMYLESGFADEELLRLVGMHTSESGPDAKGGVGWSDTWGKESAFDTLDNHTLSLTVPSEGKAQVDNATVEIADIYASNGVLHIVSSLLIPPGALKLNAEKYLLALNATSFVSLLRAANLTHYIDDAHDGAPWTILAPPDDVFSFATHPTRNDTELERVLRYHFIPGRLTPEDLKDGMLLGTELREPGLKGGRQRLAVTVSGSGGKVTDASGNGEVGFGGAMVIGSAVDADESIIYLLSKVLEPPPDMLEAMLPSSRLSTFLAAVFASTLEQTLRNTPSSTVLVPRNAAFESLGLLTTHLLSPSARRDLERVVKHHVIKSVLYNAELGVDGTHATLEGSDVRIEGGKVTPSGGWGGVARLAAGDGDELTRTGVVHELEGVLIPRSVKVDVEALVVAAKGSTMAGLVRRAGLGGALNGTLTLDEVEQWDERTAGERSWWRRNREKKEQVVGWTLLCPTDEAFKSVNITRLHEDDWALQRFVRQHIVPTLPPPSAAGSSPGSNAAPDTNTNTNTPLPFVDEATYSTLLSPTSAHGDIIFRTTDHGQTFLLGIKGVNGPGGETEYAKVLSYGRTTVPGTPRSGVVQIDRVLRPWEEGWWTRWGAPLTGGGAGVILIGLFFWGVVWLWNRGSGEATYEPLEGEEDQ